MRRPECILTRWSHVVAAGKGSHLAGSEGLGLVRVSTAVRAFHPDGFGGPEAVTASGQRYVLLGNPDPENGVSIFLDVVGQRYDLAGCDVHAVTYEEARELIRANEGLMELIVPDPERDDDSCRVRWETTSE